MSWPRESQRHSMSSRGIKTKRTANSRPKFLTTIFSKQNQKRYEAEDLWWEQNVNELIKKYNAKAAIYKGVVVYINYIPLYRIKDDEDSFKMAKSNTIYIWNLYDIDTREFNKTVKEIVKQLPKKYKVETSVDPGGF